MTRYGRRPWADLDFGGDPSNAKISGGHETRVMTSISRSARCILMLGVVTRLIEVQKLVRLRRLGQKKPAFRKYLHRE